jgi:hypothetical protein
MNDIKIQKEEPVATEEATIPEQKIRPIVGVITGSSSENVVTVKRKKRLHKLKSPDPMPWEDPGTALVFAVRK